MLLIFETENIIADLEGVVLKLILAPKLCVVYDKMFWNEKYGFIFFKIRLQMVNKHLYPWTLSFTYINYLQQEIRNLILITTRWIRNKT